MVSLLLNHHCLLTNYFFIISLFLGTSLFWSVNLTCLTLKNIFHVFFIICLHGYCLNQESVAPHITVAKKVWAGLESHFNSVMCKGHSALSKREWLWQWRESPKVNCLLDISKSTSNPNSFNENEKAQKAPRVGYICEGIDIWYQISKEKELQHM